MESNSACAADEEERSCQGYNSNSDEQDEEDVSLCDFPVNLIKDGNQTPCSTNKGDAQIIETQAVEEFDFGSVCGQVIETHMCAADEVFFKGQILPLRLSISSDNGLTNFRQPSSQNASRCISRSESMDHMSLGGLRSISSGSTTSSISSNSNSNSAAMTITRVTSESGLVRNQFHSHPSPKPQIRTSSSNARLERITSRNHHQKSSSSMWDFFRMGLVRTPPDIELQDLNYKVLRSNSRANKGSVSRNSSVNSSDNTTIIHNNNKNNNNTSSKIEVLNNVVVEKQRRQRFIISGCKCSAEAVASNAIIMKNRSCSDQSSCGFNNDNDNSSGAKTSTRAMKELKKKKKQKQKAQQQGKQADLSNHRTYEWLKELSHANFPMYV